MIEEGASTTTRRSILPPFRFRNMARGKSNKSQASQSLLEQDEKATTKNKGLGKHYHYNSLDEEASQDEVFLCRRKSRKRNVLKRAKGKLKKILRKDGNNRKARITTSSPLPLLKPTAIDDYKDLSEVTDSSEDEVSFEMKHTASTSSTPSRGSLFNNIKSWEATLENSVRFVDSLESTKELFSEQAQFTEGKTARTINEVDAATPEKEITIEELIASIQEARPEEEVVFWKDTEVVFEPCRETQTSRAQVNPDDDEEDFLSVSEVEFQRPNDIVDDLTSDKNTAYGTEYSRASSNYSPTRKRHNFFFQSIVGCIRPEGSSNLPATSRRPEGCATLPSLALSPSLMQDLYY